MSRVRLRSGIFLPPLHPLTEDPTLAMERDLDLMVWLDRLGYDEAWIGEHHSAGFETIASPELFIAHAAVRTQRIKLGTGVVSLPYHHPFMVAERIMQLDHMTRGRVMFGAGPGLLPSDAHMLGLDPSKQRPRMEEALLVILRLLRGETVTMASEWFTLREARLQLRPYSDPHPEVCVASTVTPSGGRLAGLHDLGLLCLAATNSAGFDALATNWSVAQTVAAEQGRTINPSRVRLVGPVHLAETRAEALRDVRFGFASWLDYFARVNPIPTPRTAAPASGDPLDAMIASNQAVVGTPDDAIAQIRRLEAKIPDFGCFLHIAHNWANTEATRKSYELWQRYVVPAINGTNAARQASFDWAVERSEGLTAGARKAADEAMARHRETVERAVAAPLKTI